MKTMIPYLDIFLETLALDSASSQKTLAAYESDLLTMAKLLSEKTLLDWHSDDFTKLQSLFQEKKLAKSTVARRFSALRRYYLFLKRENLVDDVPIKHIPKVKLPQKLPKTLSVDEMTALIQIACTGRDPESKRLSAMLQLLYASGMRVSELVSLPFNIIKPDMPYLLIRGKGNKERIVPVSEQAKRRLDDYIAIRPYFFKGHQTSSPYLFPSASKQGHLTRQRFGQLLKNLSHDAGIAPQRVSPHIIRHAFATHLLSNGADLRAIQQFLGHSDIATTQIYTHVSDKKLKDFITNHHPLAES